MIRWFSLKRFIVPGLLLLFLFYYLRVRKHEQQRLLDLDGVDAVSPLPVGKFDSVPSAPRSEVEEDKPTGDHVDASKLAKPVKPVLDEMSRKPFELSDADIKKEYERWDQQRVSMAEHLWNSLQVVMIPVQEVPKDPGTRFQVFRQSIIRHVSIFYGDYQRAGGKAKRAFAIPECSEIGLGREDNEAGSKELDSLAGSQGDIKFKRIPYYSGGRSGPFLTDTDGSVTMVTKYFTIREKPKKKGEKDTETAGQKEKRLRKNKEKSRQNYLRELAALNAFSHPNIVHGVCKTESRLQIVYPFLRGGDMVPLDTDALGLRVSTRSGGRVGVGTEKVLNPDQTFLPRFTRQLVSAVAHMHAAGYLHLDLKPENLVVAGPDRNFQRPAGSPDLAAYDLVLIDFGLSEVEAQLGDECLKSGTEVTMAPEQVLCNDPIGFGTDWWGFAAALFRVRVFWEPSIGEKTRSAVLHERDPQWGHVALPMQSFFAPTFRSFLELLLVPHPDDREFDRELGKLTGHPYLKEEL